MKLLRRIKKRFSKKVFALSGTNISIGTDSFFSFENIEIGSDVYIGPRANFMSTNAKIQVGNKVLFGPNVTIITGDHRFDVIGQNMFDITEKRLQDDQNVCIKDDVWIGANTTILKGVTIEKGCIIGAGSVLTKSTLPYGIYGGNPAKLIRMRFSEIEIEQHEKMLEG